MQSYTTSKVLHPIPKKLTLFLLHLQQDVTITNWIFQGDESLAPEKLCKLHCLVQVELK